MPRGPLVVALVVVIRVVVVAVSVVGMVVVGVIGVAVVTIVVVVVVLVVVVVIVVGRQSVPFVLASLSVPPPSRGRRCDRRVFLAAAKSQAPP